MRSSTMATRLFLIFLVGGTVGWIFSRRPAATEITPPEIPAAETTAPKKPRHPRSPEDFAAWAEERAAEMEPYGNWYKSYGAELADWPLEKIRSALNQGISDPGAVLPMGNEMKALFALFSEFAKREPDAAWAWLQAVPSEAMRADLASGLLATWPAGRAEEGLALVIANRDYFESGGGYGYAPMTVRALEAAAIRGPAAADEVLATLSREGMQWPFGQIKFPDGFDFAAWARCPAMAAVLQKNGIPGFFIDNWMAREPQAAMDFVLALNREQGQPLARGLFPYVNANYRKEPEPLIRRAQAVAASTASLPAEEQEAIFEAAASAFTNDPALFREFSAALPDEETRAGASLAAARVHFAKDVPRSLELLAEGRSPEQRVAVLEELLASRDPGEFEHLHPLKEKAIRKTLGDWKLSSERIDELIGIIKTQPTPKP